MIAVDTNILVHAHRRDSEWHQRAAEALRGLAEGRAQWAIPWPCIHEFVAIVTHPRVFVPPSMPGQAVAQVEAWLASPGLVLLSESAGYWEVLARFITQAGARGGLVHDARVAALCSFHGVRELWTTDRDFARFPALRVRNPLVGA